jgi:two-component sensor histidine kinase
LDESEIRSPNRLSALARASLLDTDPESYFDHVTRLAARLLNSKTTLLSLVDDDRQFFKSQCGLSEPYATSRGTPLSHSFCKHVVSSKQPLIVADARKVPMLADNAAISDLNVIAYLGIPVRAPDKEVIGSLCAINFEPRDWSAKDVELMIDLALIVEDEIALREQARQAITLAQENAILAREYHHRVKNTLAVSAALVTLSGKDATSIDDLISIASKRLSALASAHDALIATSDDVDLEDLAARLLQPYCPPGSTADVSGPQITLRHHQVTPICLFLHELATNSAKYGAFRSQGRVSIRWDYADDRQILLNWHEALANGTRSAPAGFGSRLLELAARQLGGQSSTAWANDELTITLGFPQRAA